MKPEALFLDLDGTLLDGSDYDRSIIGTCEAIAKADSGLRAGLSGPVLYKANQETWGDYWQEIGDSWSLGLVDDAAVRSEAWRRTLADCGCDDESLLELALRTHLELARQTYRLFDDVGGLIEAAKRESVPLALITNGASPTQRDKLRSVGIEDWFRAVVISGEVGVAKPDSAVFRLAIERLGLDHPSNGRDVWHVGDSLANDVGGSKLAGLTAVWINRGGLTREKDEPEPDLEITSLSEL
ncbi:MAG: HAD family hydrolase, partial [Acidimicrobiia bacterium]